MNQKQEEKRRRLAMLKNMLTEEPRKTEDLVNLMIVNFAISRRTALEEIKAVKFYMEEESESDRRGSVEEDKEGSSNNDKDTGQE